MKRFLSLSVCSSFFLFLAILPIHGEIQVLTEDSPPGEYLDNTGRVAGPTTELVRILLRKLGITGDIQLLPWKRAYNMALSGAQVALFETARTPEREKLFKWVGPIKRIQWEFFAESNSTLQIRSLEDAKKVDSILVYAGDSKGTYLKENGFTNLQEPATPVQAFKMLLAGRADLWFYSDMGPDAVAEEAGGALSEIKPVFVSKVQYLYIALSKSISDPTVALWQRKLDELKVDGTLARAYRGTYPEEMIAFLSNPRNGP